MNFTSYQFLEPADLLVLFFDQVCAFPDKVAVVTHETQITYYALAERAAILAGGLRRVGVVRETPVAILLLPGIEQIISQLGILMAGGSCVPLDPHMPEDWLNNMLDDLHVDWTISTPPRKHRDLHTKLLDFYDLLNNKKKIEQVAEIVPGHRTHILFTSGTTGRPKAVEIEAKGIVRLVVNADYVKIASDDRIACIASPTFDASLFEVWGALLNGATMIVIRKRDILDIQRFQELLVRWGITVMFITTALFNLVAATAPETFRFFRYLLVGGETASPHMLKLVFDAAPPEHLLNVYGPTECTTFSLAHPIRMADLTAGSIPIGRPINRTVAFILDDCLRPVVPGEVGHLYIGGDGLARGYWALDELTKERFIKVTLPRHSSPLRLYKTGDLGLQRSDGIFMYHGRLDNQVKIRGHRIEMEDIEFQILKRGNVRAAVALLVSDENADPYLAAFLVPQNPPDFSVEELRLVLLQHLPDYMMPRLFVISDVPFTPTGKIDKKKLLAMLPASAETVEDVGTLNAIEHSLLLMWRKILNIQNIGITDHFFQLGGSSLQAARLIIELKRHFKQDCSVQLLYGAPTIHELAVVLSQKKETPAHVDVVQWLQDAQLPSDIQPLPALPQEWSASDGATVLLTGATGFLGAFFLRDLLARPNIKSVICLIRAPNEKKARQRIKHNLVQYGLWSDAFDNVIVPVRGDLSLPELGLNKQLYKKLALEVGAVFHLGAHVNYIQPYQAHRSSNIEGTLNVLRLVTQGNPKPLHYVSTIAAFGPAGLLNNVHEITEEDDLKPYLEGMKYDSGYSQSQWVVEQFIWEAQQRGVPLSVYRPGFIMGDSINGVGNPKDFVSRLIRGCIKIGAYPALPRQRKEFVPVDYVSSALLTIALDNRNLGQAYHLVPPDHTKSVELDSFFELLSSVGYSLQKLPYSDWVNRLDSDPELADNPLMPLLPMLSEKVYKNLTRWEVYENMPIYDASHTQAALAATNSHLKPRPMDSELLSLYLSYWEKTGAFT